MVAMLGTVAEFIQLDFAARDLAQDVPLFGVLDAGNERPARKFRGLAFDFDEHETANLDYDSGIFVLDLDVLGSKDSDKLSDFEHSLLVVCKCEAVDPKNAGILAFVPEYYARSIEQAKTSALEAYFGEVKKRVRGVSLTYLKSTGWESQFGYIYLHTFAGPAGERILWKSSANIDATAGATIQATFTVKAHEEYKGHKQTKVSRLVDESTPAFEAKDQWGNPL